MNYQHQHTIIIPGQPQGKQRPRHAKSGAVYTPSETRAYEKKVKACWYECTTDKFHGAVMLEITAGFEIPKSVPISAKAAMAEGIRLPSKKPDIDNVIKIIMDGLNGAAYEDDKQVIEVIGRKIYKEKPCVIVRVKEI